MTKKNEQAPMFEFEGSKYPYFVANRTGNIGSPIINPQTGKQMAILGADFMWTETAPFLEHLNLNIRDERGSREDETYRRRANLVTQNQKLFGELVQSGYIVKIDEFNGKSEPIAKTRAEMLAYQPEIQSTLIDDWLGNFHVERYFPAGVTDVDALLATPESIFFKCLVGDFKNPAHVLIFEFDVPNPDQRRSYENDTFLSGSKADGDKVVSVYHVQHQAKLRFAKKFFRRCEGAMLAKEGEVNVEIADLRAIEWSDSDLTKEFLRGFTPSWWVRLADELAGCFNFAGK